MKFAILLYSTFLLSQESKIKFDPTKLNDPVAKWPKIISQLDINTDISNEVIVDTTKIIIEGFRIQLIATQELVNLEKLQKDLFNSYNQNTYIVFEAPNYKLRMGNFIDRSKAEIFRQRLRKEGYPSAWIIRTRIEPRTK